MKRLIALFLFAAIAAFGATGTATVGQTATFWVTLGGGTAPFSYQWMKNGVPITGATSATYVLFPVVLSNAGTYSVAVTDSLGQKITSDNGVLSVNPAVVPFTSAVLGLETK